MLYLAALLGFVALVVLGLLVTAQIASRTPHGRLKPIFALVFGLTRLRGGAQAEGALHTDEMTDPESIARIRAEFLAGTVPLSKPTPFDGRVEDRILEAPDGPIPIRIYTPSGSGPWPLLVYLHGGGFVVGHPDYTDAVTRGIAAAAPAVVVSVDYRMAPEHPFPVPVEDTQRAIDWCVEHADVLGIRADAIAVGGDSAGGNLAAVAAQRDRDEGRGRIALQILIYPTVDGARHDRTSQVAFARGYGLSTKDVRGCFDLYVPADTDATDPRVSPLYASTFEGLPKALVFTAGFDVLRDEGLEYVERLEKAGVEVEHVHQPAMPHGYITMTRLCREAREDIARMARAVGALARD